MITIQESRWKPPRYNPGDAFYGLWIFNQSNQKSLGMVDTILYNEQDNDYKYWVRISFVDIGLSTYETLTEEEVTNFLRSESCKKFIRVGELEYGRLFRS